MQKFPGFTEDDADVPLEEARKKTAEAGIAKEDVADAVQWARKKKKIVGRIIKRRNKIKAVTGDVADWIREVRRERDSRYGA